MRDTPCFQHNSCDGTPTFTRVLSYYTGKWSNIGENINTGRSFSDGFISVHAWIYEIGATPGETGHRDSIFSKDFTLVGAGFAPGGTKFQNYWTQDFIGTPVARAHMGDGIHFPQAPAAGGAVSFGTTYFDAGAKGPGAIFVVVGGACTPLALKRGKAGNAAYEASLPLAAGCHGYWFLARNGSTTETYPDSGALQVAVGGAPACPLFAAGRVDIACDGTGGMPDAATADGPTPSKPDAGAVDGASPGKPDAAPDAAAPVTDPAVDAAAIPEGEDALGSSAEDARSGQAHEDAMPARSGGTDAAEGSPEKMPSPMSQVADDAHGSFPGCTLDGRRPTATGACLAMMVGLVLLARRRRARSPR